MLELDPSVWTPLSVAEGSAVRPIAFIDGVRRIDARVWIESDKGTTLSLCASCAAGVVRCNGKAHVEAFETARYLIGPELPASIKTRHGEYSTWTTVSDRPEMLMNELASALSALEAQVASANRDTEESKHVTRHSSPVTPLTIVDGPLRGRENIPGAIGYVKSHHQLYLPEDLGKVVTSLSAGERTPVFLVKKSWTRYTWYMRLPCAAGHAWSGIVRCEAPPTLSVPQAIEAADAVTATLPAFASQPHKDGRAPQNLYPIKGLEDCLRNRLGDADLMFRSISVASAQA